MRIDCRNSSAQCLVARDEDDVSIVSRERFDVVNGGQRASERVIFDQPSGKEFVRGAKNISERDPGRFVTHLIVDLKRKFAMARATSPAREARALPRHYVFA